MEQITSNAHGTAKQDRTEVRSQSVFGRRSDFSEEKNEFAVSGLLTIKTNGNKSIVTRFVSQKSKWKQLGECVLPYFQLWF